MADIRWKMLQSDPPPNVSQDPAQLGVDDEAACTIDKWECVGVRSLGSGRS